MITQGMNHNIIPYCYQYILVTLLFHKLIWMFLMNALIVAIVFVNDVQRAMMKNKDLCRVFISDENNWN